MVRFVILDVLSIWMLCLVRCCVECFELDMVLGMVRWLVVILVVSVLMK